MPPTQEETPFYIRTAGGNTFYVETLEEALEQFVGENGYRLSFEVEDKILTVRRSEQWEAVGSRRVSHIGNSVEAWVTWTKK